MKYYKQRVASLYKKGDPNKQENYRPISLLNSFYKIIAAVIKKRLEEVVDERLMSTKFGFRKKKSPNMRYLSQEELKNSQKGQASQAH